MFTTNLPARAEGAALALLLALPAGAATITDPALLSAGATVETFDGLAAGPASTVTSGPMTLTTARQNIGATNTAVFTWGAPGFFPAPSTPSGVFGGNGFGSSAPHVFTFEFSSAVAEFGLGLYDSDTTANTLTAFDKDGGVLETLTFALANNAGQFGGFKRAANDIAKVVLTPAGSDGLWIDGVSWFAAPATPDPDPQPDPQPDPNVIPLPAGLPLLLAGLGVLGLIRRRTA